LDRKFSTKRTTELLKLSRFQTRQMPRPLTGHCHLKQHLRKIKPTVEGATTKQEQPHIPFVIVRV
jgi:hypothetical protein